MVMKNITKQAIGTVRQSTRLESEASKMAQEISATRSIGMILAMGVIRLLERQEQLAMLTEESVHTGVLTTQENALE
jgi:hypothetical protein